MSLPDKCLVDTNVPKIANLDPQLDTNSDMPAECVLSCIEAVEHFTKKGGILIIDLGDEIFNEYRGQLNIKGGPGVGDGFMKWVDNHRCTPQCCQRVFNYKNGDSYNEFPEHEGLIDFDISDRKFVAAANAHPDKPPILQAADSKWWGWKDALEEVGITAYFLCPEYIKAKYDKKMGGT